MAAGFVERVNHLKVTFVFITTIIIPSLLLSAFAYQAIEGERVARRIERKRRLADDARTVVRDLDDGFRAPAREVRLAAARLRGRLQRAQDAAPALERVVERAYPDAPLVEGKRGAVYVYAPDARRVFPAGARGVPTPVAPPSAPAALGGPTASASPLEPVALLSEAEARMARPDGRARAIQLLERLRLGAAPETILAAKLGIARALLLANDEVETTLAASGLKEIVGEPIDLLDPLGRPVVAHARMDYALVAATQRQRTLYRERLAALLLDLERKAAFLPAEDFQEIAHRIERYLLAEGGEWAAEAQRAHEVAAARAQLEKRAEHVDDVFLADVREALRQAKDARRPAGRSSMNGASMNGASMNGASPLEPPGGGAGDGSPHLSDPASLSPRGANANEPSWFLRRQSGGRYEVLLLAPLERADGSLLGMAAFPVDLDGLTRRLLAQRLARSEGDFDLSIQLAQETADELDRATVPLAYPLDYAQVVVRTRDAEEDVLTRERTTMKLWVVALSIAGVFAGALVTSWTVIREAKAAGLKSDFVANVTHELRTPLTSIRMFIETLELGRVESAEEQKECLSIMARETDRLTRLIERLLAFSKIESRKWRFKFSYVPPAELASESLRLLRDQLQIKEGDPFPVEVESIQDVPPVAVDKDAMVEVLLNLLTNAWKYSPGPDRRIKIVLRDLRKHVSIDVEDNGIGVPRRDRRRIWKKFERGSNAEKGRIEGSGIGLTLALSIAKGHGGTITLTPLKQGSRFSLVLPKVGGRG